MPASCAARPEPELAVRRFLAFAGDAPLVAHNARFDVGFLDRAVERLTGQRVAAPVVDTVWLARRLLHRRSERFSLQQLAHFFGTTWQPCHRALPDALATAEILIALLGLAQERGARTIADVVELAAPRARRLHSKRSLVAGAPSTPGVYLFRDRNDTVLYVGKARDLRARLRSYFSGDRQRPAVEAALGALERVEWRVLGSELEAALEELRLIRELRPPANARGGRPDRYVYLAAPREVVGRARSRARSGRSRASARRSSRRGRSTCSRATISRRRFRRCARSFGGSRATCASRTQRACAIASLRSRTSSSESPSSTGCAARACACSLPRASRASGARSSSRAEECRAPHSRRGCGKLEVEAGLAEAALAEPSLAPEDADELLVVSGFLRRPGPELRVVSLDATRSSPRRSLGGVSSRPDAEPTRVTSPTGSSRPSRASTASSWSVSTRGSTCCRWSCAARQCSGGRPPRRRSRASARGSSTRSGRTSSR